MRYAPFGRTAFPNFHKEVNALQPILSLRELVTQFSGDFGTGAVVDHVSFDVYPHKTLCIVGESGCGKSVTCLSMLGLLNKNGKVTQGEVWFEGQNLLALTEKELDRVRWRKISMIFQDALSSLNPVFTVGNQLTEAIRAHTKMDKKKTRRHALELLAKVGLPDPESIYHAYPHTLSGGQRQRVMIAMALSCNPRILIADEPTTALDVTIQKQIMALLKQLQQETGMSILLITHDMGLVAQMADQVLVMYAGQIVESAPVKALFHSPAHPYTRALLRSVPSIRDDHQRVLESIQDTVPEHYETLTGCRFRSRCPYAVDACAETQQTYDAGDSHWVRCHRWKEVAE